MDSIVIFVKALIIGIAIAAPVGPVAALCIYRTLNGGVIPGGAAGLGAALADGFYGAIAALGVTAVQDLLISYKSYLAVIGGCYLLYMGTQFFKHDPTISEAPKKRPKKLHSILLASFGITIANPITIFAFLFLFTSFQLSTGGHWFGAMILISGVFAGACLWWGTLVGIVSLTRKRMTDNVLHNVNRLSGVMIIVFAVYLLGSVVWESGWIDPIKDQFGISKDMMAPF